MNITAEEIIEAIDALPKDRTYSYVNQKNHGLIRITSVDLPRGPVRIKRWDPGKGKSESDVREESISYNLILRLANSLYDGEPVNLDRTLGGSYNTRSVLEALLVHTPQFYQCYPGRIQIDGEKIDYKDGQKHIVWVPRSPHSNGYMAAPYTDVEVISEIPPRQASYRGIELRTTHGEMSIEDECLNRCAQMKIASYYIGKHLDYHTWISQEDHRISYCGRPIESYNKVVKSLASCPAIKTCNGAEGPGNLIDCMWLTPVGIPAVMEVEQSGDVRQKLARMLDFSNRNKFPDTRYVIIAPDSARNTIKRESNRDVFSSLETKFFPYSAVEELYDLCQRRNIRGVGAELVDCFMEEITS